jgi:hypothetical protein
MHKHPTQDQIRKDAKYEDGNLFWLPRGYGKFDKQFAGKKVGCVVTGKDGRQWISTNYKKHNYLVHRLVWIYHNGSIPSGFDIDHINNNSLDNRIENLRLATKQQNSFNTPLRKDNTSGVKGVVWNKATKSWRARLFLNGIGVQIGMFNSLDDAKEAMKMAREINHGEFANHGNKGIQL